MAFCPVAVCAARRFSVTFEPGNVLDYVAPTIPVASMWFLQQHLRFPQYVQHLMDMLIAVERE